MRLRTLSVVLVVLSASCAERKSGQLLENQGASASEVKGLVRESGEGPFLSGEVEHFTAVLDASAVKQVRWSATAGALETQGVQAWWTLPAPGTAELSVSVTMKDGREVSASWAFQVIERPRVAASSAAAALLATPMPALPLDGGTAEITGGACDLQYDSAANLHLAFTSSTHPGLYYGKWNGTAWTVELVDGMGFNTGGDVDPARVSMAIDPSNNPHLAYLVKNTVGYATKSGSTWTRERVDSATVPLHGGATYPVSIALNPAASNKPTISYTYWFSGTADPRTAIATRSGPGAWTIAQPVFAIGSTVYAQTVRGEIAFNAAGTLFLPMLCNGVGASGNYLTSWTPTAMEFVLVTGSSGGPGFDTTKTALAWAGANRLLARTVAGVYDVTIASPLNTSTIAWSRNETTGSAEGDLAWSAKPYVLHNHGGMLELVTPNASGFWTYTQLGSTQGTSASLVLHPTTGAANICYQSGGRIMFQ